MAYFADNDLQDCVRNGFIVEDNTGICGLVLPPVKPRARPGGLPITFGGPVSESESDESHSPDFRINPEMTVIPSGIVPLSICARKEDNKQGKVVYYAEKRMKAIQPFTKVTPQATKKTTSLTTKLLEETEFTNQNPFVEYAKFDIGENVIPSKCKEFSVTMTFAEPTTEELQRNESYILTLNITNSAKISDLIGLCCFVYTRAGRKPPCNSINDFQLYLADDDNSADTDFPRVDPNSKVAQCCFQKLALVRKADLPNFRDSKMTVNVYLINGDRYSIEIESQDTSLEYIRDEALFRKNADIPSTDRDPGLRRVNEYVLELLSQPDVPVKLSMTVANVGCTEFLLLRKNSTRGDFKVPIIKPRMIGHCPSLPGVNNSPSTPISATRFGTPTLSAANGDSQFGFPSNEPTDVPPEEFIVERLHRIRPKWSATLIIHPDALEVTPLKIEPRRTLVPQSTPKLTFLDFNVIASAHLSTDRPHGKRQIRIVWLWVPTEKMHELYSALKELNAKESPFSSQCTSKRPSSALAVVEEEEMTSKTLRSHTSISNESDVDKSRRSSRASTDKTKKTNDFITLLEGSRWKTLHLETKEDDAWKIGVKLNNIIESRFSYVRILYEQSRNGSRSPLDAAMKMDKLSKAPVTPTTKPIERDPPRPTTPQTPGKSRRKISMNPMPILSRVLSRQD